MKKRKNKLANLLKIAFIPISFFLIIFSCETNEYSLPNSAEQISEFDNFQTKFNTTYINQELLLGEDNLQTDWHSGEIINFSKKDSTTVYEFNGYLKNPITIESKEFFEEYTYKLIVIEQANHIDFKVLRFEPFKNSINVQPTYKNINQFSGNKFELNEFGEIELLETYKDGEVVASLDLTEKEVDSSNTLQKEAPNDCRRTPDFNCDGGGSSSGGSSGGGYTRETTYYYTDWYINGEYRYTAYNGSSTSWVYVSGSHGYSNGNSGGNAGSNSRNSYTHHGPNKGPNVSNNDRVNTTKFLNQDVWDTQDPYDKWNKLTECERDFFTSNPQHLYTARGNKAEAEKVAWERFGNCNTPNDRPMLNTIGDAYRHAYFAALNTHNMGHTNAKSIGDAHECDTPSNKLDQKQMDLHNNAWGYHYGSTI